MSMNLGLKRTERILKEVEKRIKNSALEDISVRYTKTGYKKDNTLPAVDEAWIDYHKGIRFGGYDKHFWFYTAFKTPACNSIKELRFTVNTDNKSGVWDSNNPQCILYANGELVQGLDYWHHEYNLESEKNYEIYIYAYTGTTEAYYDLDIGVVEVDRLVEKLYYDLLVPYETAILYGENEYEQKEIIKHLDFAENILDFSSDEHFRNSCKVALEYLEKNLYGCYPQKDVIVDMIGHSHIDVAWKWTYSQTREKVQRTFSSLLRLMERYPYYKFVQSQPQLLEFLKEEAPQIYKQFKKLVADGRIEVEGAMWVEPDCNLTSGESFIRQIMFGKRFIKDEFGTDSKILWLPDVFGYSAALPQILKKSGIDKFVTSKISWNETNKMPYDSFMWKGIDGTEILTYFITARNLAKIGEDDTHTNYSGDATPSFVLGTWERYQQKELSNEVFELFGWGDGGGGPTERMLESIERLNKGLLGLPKTRVTTASESLNSIEEKINKAKEITGRIPKWVGELYLEFHRGTYTGVAKAKRYNRKLEIMCQNAEKISVLDMVLTGASYPYKDIRTAWKNILLNQFHDVLPGSSIKAVYDDAFSLYEQSLDITSSIMDKSLKNLSKKITEGNEYVVFNPNGFAITDVIKTESGYVTCEEVPSFGWKVVRKQAEESKVNVDKRSIENSIYRVVFDEDYNITSIFDKKNGRETIVSGKKANEFIMYEDLPYEYDAWELSKYHRYKSYRVDEVISVKEIDEGARAGLEIVKRFRQSIITQTVHLYNAVPRIDFFTVADWHEKDIMFKVAFPVDVNTSKAVYDIQFGNIERSHHENTSWDAARFETVAHKWADISDGGYGMTLINDCKYGYSIIDDSTIQLSLIKCSKGPLGDQNDWGKHEFAYSIIPHQGDFKASGIIKQAIVFNNPLKAILPDNGKKELPQEYAFIRTNSENVVVETIKKAENSDDIIVRLYDAYNKKSDVFLQFGVDIRKAYICDLLENIETELKVENNSLNIAVNNFEIVTLRLAV